MSIKGTGAGSDHVVKPVIPVTSVSPETHRPETAGYTPGHKPESFTQREVSSEPKPLTAEQANALLDTSLMRTAKEDAARLFALKNALQAISNGNATPGDHQLSQGAYGIAQNLMSQPALQGSVEEFQSKLPAEYQKVGVSLNAQG